MPQSSHRQYPLEVETLFNLQLKQIRDHSVMFAVQKSFEEMGRAVFYHVDSQTLPVDNSELVSRLVISRPVAMPDITPGVDFESAVLQPMPPDEVDKLAGDAQVKSMTSCRPSLVDKDLFRTCWIPSQRMGKWSP